MNPTAAPRARRAHDWIVGAPRRGVPAAVKLFCLPYAGGGATTYASWKDALGDHVEVCPVELPGRQTRWREPAHPGVGPLVDALASALVGELDVPYALFGHSMGALVAFELARTLRRRGLGEPQVLFVSGGHAPQLPRNQPNIHDQPEAFVVERLRTLGGIAEEIYAEPELLELVLPTVRADFAVCETYEYRAEAPLGCPVVAFAGSEDREVTPARVAPWREQTSTDFVQHVLPGGHFFLQSAQDALLATVRATLAAVPARRA